uniref:DUF4291 domain-containing protein n=1 Tax=Craspedostauros australis TaxID=1486917 RepID=A0A7R9WRE8_9STRA
MPSSNTAKPSAQHKDRPTRIFRAMWDADGVYFYQAFRPSIAEYAVANQTFTDCPDFHATRMTWIKPSFGWVLYRSGYATKANQERILRIQVSHEDVAELLSWCVCGHGGGGSMGRIQWDPERDLQHGDGQDPRKMPMTRAIQIGLSRDVSHLYVRSIRKIEDVTELAHQVHAAHQKAVNGKDAEEAMESARVDLPQEREYVPHMELEDLRKIGMDTVGQWSREDGE